MDQIEKHLPEILLFTKIKKTSFKNNLSCLSSSDYYLI